MRKRNILMFVVVLIIVFIVATPYITVYQMKLAAEKHDGESLSEYIDFPSVRQSLKDQMNAVMMKEMANNDMKENPPFGVLGVAFAGVMVEKMVDAYITPSGIMQLMSGYKLNEKGNEVASSSLARKPLSDASMSYASLSKFVINVRDDSGDVSKLILRRRGLGWKLTEIIIQLDDTRNSITSTASAEATMPESITLVALDKVRVKAVQKIDGMLLFQGTMARDETKTFPKSGPIYITADYGQNLQVQYRGEKVDMGFQGYGRSELP